MHEAMLPEDVANVAPRAYACHPLPAAEQKDVGILMKTC